MKVLSYWCPLCLSFLCLIRNGIIVYLPWNQMTSQMALPSYPTFNSSCCPSPALIQNLLSGLLPAHLLASSFLSCTRMSYLNLKLSMSCIWAICTVGCRQWKKPYAKFLVNVYGGPGLGHVEETKSLDPWETGTCFSIWIRLKGMAKIFLRPEYEYLWIG